MIGLSEDADISPNAYSSIPLKEKMKYYDETLNGQKLKDLKLLYGAIKDNEDIIVLFENYLFSSWLAQKFVPSRLRKSRPALDLLDTPEGRDWVVKNIQDFIAYLVIFAEGG